MSDRGGNTVPTNERYRLDEERRHPQTGPSAVLVGGFASSRAGSIAIAISSSPCASNECEGA